MNENLLQQIGKILMDKEDGNSITLGDYIANIYKSYHLEINRKNTIRSESYRIKYIIEHKISKKMIHQVTETDVVKFLNDIQISKKLARSTVNRYRARLSAVFHHAEDNGYILVNIVKKVKIYKECPRGLVLSDEEIKALLLAARESKNKALYLIIVIALNTGMRKSEILGLRRENIVDDVIRLFEMTTKSGYSRDIPINDTLKTLLFDYINMLPSGRDNLFLMNDIKNAFHKACNRAGLDKKGLRMHDLRRVYATRLDNANVNIHYIKEILGHSSISMTEKYLKTNIDHIKNAVNKVGFC